MDAETSQLSPFQRTKKMGRPEYWTQERLDSLCQSLTDWAKKDSSITLTEWRADEEISWDMVKYLKQISDDFSHRYDLAKAKVIARVTRKAGRGVHPVHYNRYASVYDKELHEHDVDMASVKSTAASQSRAEDIQKGASIIDRLEASTQKDS